MSDVKVCLSVFFWIFVALYFLASIKKKDGGLVVIGFGNGAVLYGASAVHMALYAANAPFIWLTIYFFTVFLCFFVGTPFLVDCLSMGRVEKKDIIAHQTLLFIFYVISTTVCEIIY